MAELARAPTASRSALLDLRDELGLVRDGYEFLDEKRILLAAEILRQRHTWAERRREFLERFEAARRALAAAAADQGLEGLEVCPADERPRARLDISERPYVGHVMLEASYVAGPAANAANPVRPTPSLRECRHAFDAVIAAAAELAATGANLARLVHEYRRTERRVRALENIVLPEIRADIRIMEEQLDLLDQEEVVRVRTLRRGPADLREPSGNS